MSFELLVQDNNSMMLYMTMSNLKSRNTLAAQVISKYANDHAVLDVMSGLAAGIFGFGAGLAATAAQIAIAVPLFYKPLVEELGRLYLCSPDHITQAIMNFILHPA